jgi:hypothetical protein
MLTFLGERQMKTRIGNVILEVTLIIMLIASVGLADLSDGLVAYYPFNGNTNDESGNGHHGILGGDATIVWDAGGNRKGAGYVLQLDGEGDYVIVDASRAPRMRPACTISGWLKIPSTYPFPSHGAGFVNKMLHSTGFYLYDFAIGHDGPCFAGIGDGTGAPGQETTGKYVYWSDSQEERQAVANYLFDDTWHHLAYTWDPDQIVLYVDGVFQNSISHNVNVYANDPMNWDMNIGRRRNSEYQDWIYCLEASIDEVRIYNRALSPDEINGLINSPPVAVCQDVLIAVGANGYVDASVDGGSYDPDGDGISFSQIPEGPYPVGVYNVELTVTDPSEATDICQAMLVVYDPSDGFVTGGGWIWSPKGAYVANQWLEGKANFGFISKYKKGASEPTGQTEFVFQAGGLNFHSSSYDWLVVAGAKAMFKGVGTINGAGNYGFMLSAVDAALTPSTSEDRFRIKIWDKNVGDAVVYDNQIGDDDEADVTTAIGGGSIVIHTK